MNTIASTFPLDGNERNEPAPASGKRHWLARAATAIWGAFEQSGHAQAQRQLLDFASQCEAQQPELAKELRLAVSQGRAI